MKNKHISVLLALSLEKSLPVKKKTLTGLHASFILTNFVEYFLNIQRQPMTRYIKLPSS